jgi:hypothetical protein
MKKQTAVEWLEERYNDPLLKDNFISKAEFDQAKAMEKQHVMEFLEEYDSYIFRGGNTSEEEYYNYIYEN